jgi:hypothetical protein
VIFTQRNSTLILLLAHGFGLCLLKKQLDSALEKVEELEKRLKPRLQLA